MKKFKNVYVIGIDHGYGNMLCQGIFNPEDF